MMRPTSLKRSAGFTLVEAMIGLALSSTIMLGISQLFAANSQTYNMLMGQSAMQQSARFALSNIGKSIQSSGYRGCFSSNTDVYKTFSKDLPYEYNIESPVLAYEGEPTAWNPDIEAILPKTIGTTDTNVYKDQVLGKNTGINTAAIINGTDIITLNYVAKKKHQLSVDMVTSIEEVQLETQNYDFATDYLAHISDCEKQTVFRVTGFSGDLKIQHDSVPDSSNPANQYTNDFTRLAEFNTFGTEDTIVSAIASDTYYIAPSANTNKSGQNILSLWRKSGIRVPTELVDGVEDLQIKYGIDTNNDNVPNKYVDADEVTDFFAVRAIRISIVANSIDDVGASAPPTHGCIADGGRQFCKTGVLFDGMLRRRFTETIALRNRQS
jgi:type IV pilus assembly protein PilW